MSYRWLPTSCLWAATAVPLAATGQVVVFPDTLAVTSFEELQPRTYYVEIPDPDAHMEEVRVDLPAGFHLQGVLADTLWGFKVYFPADSVANQVTWLLLDEEERRSRSFACAREADSLWILGGGTVEGGAGCVAWDGTDFYPTLADELFAFPPMADGRSFFRMIGRITEGEPPFDLAFPTRITFIDGSVEQWTGPPGSAFPAPHVAVVRPPGLAAWFLPTAIIALAVLLLLSWAIAARRRRS